MALARERKVGFRMKIQRELEIGISKEIMTSVYFNFNSLNRSETRVNLSKQIFILPGK